MNIGRCDEARAHDWNAYVAGHGSFYHRFEWKAINEHYFGHQTAYLGAFDDDRLVGVLPFVQLKSHLFGNLACSMPFVNYGGPCAADGATERRLLEEAASIVEGWGVKYLEIRSRQPLAIELPTSSHKVSMTIDLVADPEILFARFKSGHRQDIRRALKNGLTARFGGAELLDDFYTVLSESWHELGTPFYDKDYFERILGAFPESVRICVVYAGTQPAAAAFDGLHGDTVEGMWLGIRHAYRRLLVGYALYWELIKDACEKGYARFHLGRSTADSNAETFKKKWNATAMPLYWSYVLRGSERLPALNTANPKFQMAVSLWRRMPRQVTNLIGPRIARSIP